jgi:hypothetical protein
MTMTDAWYDLLTCAHYLGYHTVDAMSYEFDEAQPFTLVTSNKKEVEEIRQTLGGPPRAAVWVIEGRHGSTGVTYLLREVFHPTTVRLAGGQDAPGARKKFHYRLEGHGTEFGETFDLGRFDWFPAFMADNGNFGFGLRVLRDQDVKDVFIELARPFYKKA